MRLAAPAFAASRSAAFCPPLPLATLSQSRSFGTATNVRVRSASHPSPAVRRSSSVPPPPARAPRRAPVASAAAPPTPEEITPGSPEMLARATRAKEARSDRVLGPLAASEFVASPTGGVTIIDVRTQEQASGHEIGGKAGVGVRWSMRQSLDDMVSGEVPMPRGKVLLCCSKGPKSLVALDWLMETLPAWGNDLYVLEGGIAAWAEFGLPTVDIK